jgi:hypothetical protein
MNNQKKIGWQKYEDFIEKQLTSPMLDLIFQNIVMRNKNITTEENEEISESLEDEMDDDSDEMSSLSMMMPISKELIDDISILSNFDCWIGHSNFDLTNEIKHKLDKVPGIELLKICSRYRFFIGVGQMFDFKDVRNNIEKEIIGDIND